MLKKQLILVGVIIAGLAVFAVALLFPKTTPVEQPLASEKQTSQEQKAENRKCLNSNEVASYQINKKQKEVSTATIFVSDKETSMIKRQFDIELPIPDHYHPLELHDCGVYAVRSFNYDYQKKYAATDYRMESWRYDYDGKGESVVFLSGPISGSGFSSDFRVDPQEKYMILVRGYLGSPDYALVFKDLKTKEDLYILSSEQITRQHSNIVGSFDFEGWSKEGKYFWFSIFEGAKVHAFGRIEKETWKLDIFPTQKGTKGGDAFNSEKGYVTYDDGPGWIGLDIFSKQVEEKWKEQGKIVSFYLYNLFTKEKILLFTTAEPLWWHKPKWISDTELEYTLPTGEQKVYKLE